MIWQKYILLKRFVETLINLSICDMIMPQYCWVRTYGVKELTLSDATSLTSETSDFDISNSRIGPQYKCPWCGNKRFWKHTSGHNSCDNITCWDGKTNDVTCGSCGTNCTLGGGPVTTLSGTSGNGQ